ncbi:RNA polymerase sigma factor [Gordonia neofelifaecis]|uniref:RNA polymerase sigma factor n=1 Tax=Gordonia neofelifaecis NRRL B-59395 TaxID=644548 RepID=F1YEF5_9ACTN|nr:DUF6596 domain-containing protein [Gordonia neofelifaecis]EGD56788.1 RNA polymerase sigma factor containing a TPR repeat domain [Gordonia neofelifaecis NRRL B-59395]
MSDRAPADLTATLDAVWRSEGGRVVASLVAMTRDVATAEDLAQEAIAAALVQWPAEGVPRNPGAWLTAVAKRRAIDGWRREAKLDDHRRSLIAEADRDEPVADPAALVVDRDPIDDDLLRLLFIACHPVLGREAQIALTLRTVGGLSSEAIARMFLVSVATMQARITRAKKALTAAGVPFETPSPDQWGPRLGGVLRVIYLIFTEGYSPTAGDAAIAPATAAEALRLGRMLAALVPDEAEVQALVALMEFQVSRFSSRVAPDGAAVLLDDQDRARWDRSQITRGSERLARADALGRGRGAYALQAAIAQQHALATSVETTDWRRIVELYDALVELTGSPVVELNRAVAMSMTGDLRGALDAVDRVDRSGRLRNSHLVPSVRGELLQRSGDADGARVAFEEAAAVMTNDRQRAVLLAKAAALRSKND